MNFVQYFLIWWNKQAAKNGKTKFRNQKEAAEFIRQVQNRTGGPNAKLVAMRERYVEAHAGKRGQNTAAGSFRGWSKKILIDFCRQPIWQRQKTDRSISEKQS